MPEGHTVHRVARQFRRDFVGHALAVSSPQGRFAAGAALIDGRVLTGSRAVGKQLFLEFDGGLVLRVHLGLYGAWDFFGRISPITEGMAALGSMGAPRLRRAVRMGEDEQERGAAGAEEPFPPEPVGQVRVRLATGASVADLRGPTACEVLDPESAAAAVARLGLDPATEEDLEAAGAEVARRLTRRAVPIGQLLMDQSVMAGIGNIYRAEMLFRARLDPWTPGRQVPVEAARALWDDWAVLLADGIRTGVMLTREDLDEAGRARALADRSERHWVYGRAGLPCRVCGAPVVVEDMAGRKLYRCPSCQR
ncbi:Fpg/Nei family DNA glycosylase [Cellulomonas chengniuliangii]|uniref:DNA-(apurinic or apyrimidinic site) lyase n=1 Tax=Cellulomonas chengniuliangii TaxID=2968084 RepID=A0ABY5L3D3_9CELL|nr:DNA-formamidopyrimidine glycosylase family protein [Cellulomonas chengniuliangii]MCC2309349.1 Fpg/Nei family DNA glycosylase [Cellulomonas chengniuliangii]UUI75083.1 Fpg/Nei family DNA glycosylase [Cellulomonas chengniuliangii]